MVLTQAMKATQAWERLNDVEYCGRLTMLQYHELLVEAGYSARAAREAANRRGWDRLDAGLVM